MFLDESSDRTVIELVFVLNTYAKMADPILDPEGPNLTQKLGLPPHRQGLWDVSRDDRPYWTQIIILMSPDLTQFWTPRDQPDPDLMSLLSTTSYSGLT